MPFAEKPRSADSRPAPTPRMITVASFTPMISLFISENSLRIVESSFYVKNATLDALLSNLRKSTLLASLVEAFATLLDDAFLTHSKLNVGK
jgi:hypothetical protein